MKNIWKKTLAMLLVVILIGGVSPAANWLTVIASAETLSGTFGADGDNLSWSLDTETGVMTIVGTGEMEDFEDEESTPWAESMDEIRSVKIGDEVTSIGDSAFCGCQALTEVMIGSSVERIGVEAFAFAALTYVHIPASVSEIDENAFLCMLIEENGDLVPTLASIDVDPENPYFCSSGDVLYDKTMTTLLLCPCGIDSEYFYVPIGVEEIGEGAFNLCLRLQNVWLPDSITTIQPAAFLDCLDLAEVEFGNNLETIGDNAFYECVSLESVGLPDTVTEIGAEAFASCESLESVWLGAGLETIGESAFSGCTSLSEIEIFDCVTTIDDNAFANCESLLYATIGCGVESIGAYAFTACSALESLTFNAINCTDMSSGLVFVGCSCLQEIEIGSEVTQIPDSAFIGLDALTTVMIPDDGAITAIGANAFMGCPSLESIHIPFSVTEIGSGAFDNCTNLAYICCDVEDSFAKEYAEANGIEFRVCSGAQPTELSGECGAYGDNVLWAFDPDTGVLTISGSGEMADYSDFSEPWYGFHNTLVSAVIEDGVTTIGTYAFSGCENLADVQIPKSIRSIGDGAFLAAGLTDVSFPATVEEIGDYAFLCGRLEDMSDLETLVPTLQSIVVDTENISLGSVINFDSRDGVLYDEDFTVLIQYPADKANTTFDIPYGVTEIGSFAFAFAWNLTELTMPEGTETIGYGAFYDCASLETVSIADSVVTLGMDAFGECPNLTSVTFGSGVTEIPESLFVNCTSLSTVTFPDNVVTIGDSVFSGCTSLVSVHIPSTVTAIGDNVFSDCPNFAFICSDSAVCYAKTYAEANNIEFRLCGDPGLLSGTCGIDGDNVLWTLDLTIGELTLDGEGAMADYADPADVPWSDHADAIRSLLIGSGVTTIGSNAFYACTDIANIQLPDSVTEIGSYAFGYCITLTDIQFGSSIAAIREGAFYHCDSLKSVDIPSNVAEVCAYTFAFCETLETVTIPGSVTEIGDYAFADCPALTDAALPDSVTVIGTGAFANCSSLQSAVIPDGVTEIADSLFMNCSCLEIVTIPDSVTSIGDSAFSSCSNLTQIHIPSEVTAIYANAFDNCDSLMYICSEIAGCYASVYAEENSISFVYCLGQDDSLTRIAGDVNADGVVNLKDVVLLRRFLAGGWNIRIFGACCDVNADEDITLQDVVLMCRYLVGGWNIVLV